MWKLNSLTDSLEYVEQNNNVNNNGYSSSDSEEDEEQEKLFPKLEYSHLCQHSVSYFGIQYDYLGEAIAKF